MRLSPRRAAVLQLVTLASVLVSGESSRATQGQGLTLQRVLTAVRRHHPTIVQASYDATGAEGKLLSSRGIFDPTLEFKGKLTPYGDYNNGTATALLRQQTGLWGAALVGGWEIGSGDFPLYKKDLETSDGGMALVGVEMPLLRGGPIDKGRATLRASRHERDAARMQVATVTLELSRQAAHRYWDWVAAGQRLVIATQLLQIASSRVAQISARVGRGDLAPIEEVENQRAILKREGAVVKARRTFEKAALKLSLFYRDERGRPVAPMQQQIPPTVARAPSIPAPGLLAGDIKHALSRRPELKALGAVRGVANVARRLASNAQLPKLDFSALASHDIGSEPFESRRTDVLVGLAFSFPLLVREARGALRAAEAKLGAVEAKARLLADKIAIQVRDAYSAMHAAREALDIALREVKVSHRVEEAERERLELGASTLLLVNLREQAAAEAEFRAVDAAAALQRSLANYGAATARGL